VLVSSRFLDCGASPLSRPLAICAGSVGWAACCHGCVESVVSDEGGGDTAGLAGVLLSWCISFCYLQCEYCIVRGFCGEDDCLFVSQGVIC
jgi:hypothetical protein